MTLEIINKLFLELSQVATATTRKEHIYKTALKNIVETKADTDGTLAMKMRLTAKEALRAAQIEQERR